MQIVTNIEVYLDMVRVLTRSQKIDVLDILEVGL